MFFPRPSAASTPSMCRPIYHAAFGLYICYCYRLLQFSNGWTTDLFPDTSELCPLCSSSLVADLGPRDHVTEHMKRLHWLSIQFWIKFKLCVLMHGAVYGQSPSYIKDVFVQLSDLSHHSRLRSAAAGQYDVHFTRTQFGRRA